jgi:hypothetical protein
MRVADCKPARLGSIPRHVSTLLLSDSARPSKPMRPGSNPGGSATAHSSTGRTPASRAVKASSILACVTDVSAGGSGGRSTKPACEGSTPSRDATCSCRWNDRGPPKPAHWVRFPAGAPQGSGQQKPTRLITWGQKRTRCNSEPCNGDDARCGAGFIRQATFAVRVRPSPLRDRLLARTTKL